MTPLLGKGLKLGTAGSGVVMFQAQIPDGRAWTPEIPWWSSGQNLGLSLLGLGFTLWLGTKDPATCTVRQKGKERVWTPPGVAKAGTRERPELGLCTPTRTGV